MPEDVVVAFAKVYAPTPPTNHQSDQIRAFSTHLSASASRSLIFSWPTGITDLLQNPRAVFHALEFRLAVETCLGELEPRILV